MTEPVAPPPASRIAPVLRTIGQGLARGADAVRRGVEALDVPMRLADARDDLRALEIDRRAAALARRGGSAARRTAGLARVRTRRAAAAGAPALRQALVSGAARLGTLAARRPPRVAAPADPMARPADLPAIPPASPPLATVPLFAADGAAAPVPPPVQTAARTPAHAPGAGTPATRWLEDRRTQMTIAIAGLGLAGMAAALAAAPPAAGPAPGSVAFGEAVRAYILDHPEIIPEAVARLQARETDTTLSRNRAALQTPFSGAWAGAANGDVVLVEFSDYACGFCRASVRDVDRLLAEDPRLKIVYREIPILGPGSEQAATLALAAARQGRHAAVHRALFAAGSPAAEKSAQVIAATRMDPAATARDRADPVIAREIAANLALARDIGLTGTPTFVVGNRILSGAVGYDALKAAVAEARAGG